MITSPATHGAIGAMVPGYNFEVGAAITYQGAKNGDKLQAGLGILGMVGGMTDLPTGTVWDDIRPTQPNYPGSVLPKSFELSTGNGVKVWVHGNATEHIAEFIQMKAVNYTPEVVRLATQMQLKSLQSAVNAATMNGVIYDQMMEVGGWELKFGAPKANGQLPVLFHAQPIK